MTTHETALNYAKGLFELSHEMKTLDDLASIELLVQAHPKLMRLLGTHESSLANKKQLLETLFTGHIDPILQQFFRYLVEKGKFNLIASITHEYRRLILDKAGILKATLVSAMPVHEDHKAKLALKLATFYQKQVEIEVRMSPEIVGGAILMIGNQMIDLTLSTQLAKLTKKLLAAQI